MTVVAAVDASDKSRGVAEEAAQLGAAFDEPVHFVHVLTSAEFRDLEETSVDETGQPLDMDEVRAVASNRVETVAEAIDHPVEAVGLMGDPAERIVGYADDHDARYVVVGGRKRSPTGKAIFGSTSQSIIMNASCPVVVSIQ